LLLVETRGVVFEGQMQRSTPRRPGAIGLLVPLLIVLATAQATQTLEQAPAVLPPEIAKPQYEPPRGLAFKHAGIAVYAAGALFDLYTTKRALDAGLLESNPLLRADHPNRTLATAAVAKLGFGIVIGTAGRHTGNRARGAWFLSLGVAQLGYGVANRNATIHEREATAAASAAAAK
jgi:hypothetical protein